MKDIWNALEERTQTWQALGRQGLADALWADYVSIRFGRTGNPHALDYLYPYLNHADKGTRLKAIDVAACVFEGRGPKAIDALDYFTKNPDPFLRDRAVQVVGAAVSGSRDKVILEVLSPYLNHRNQFIRKLALIALGKAAAGQARSIVLQEIQRVAQTPGPREGEVQMAIATTFAGHPTEEVYTLVAKSGYAVSILVRGASDEWYQRACREIFEPLLHPGDEVKRKHFVQRSGIGCLCNASPGRGMEALRKILHLRNSRCTGHAMMSSAQECFAGADPKENRAPLIELAKNGDVQEQRIAAVCFGRMMMGVGDEETINALRGLCNAKNKAVQAAALAGLGMAARSTCDEELRELCLERALEGETASAAIRALGMIFLGSGRSDVFKDICEKAEFYRNRPVRGKRYCKPLAVCYWATGLNYLGTGSMEPLEFLLDVLSLPKVPRTSAYQWAAAMALVMIEFSEAKLGWTFFNYHCIGQNLP
jgi:HEAT repeat protein